MNFLGPWVWSSDPFEHWEAPAGVTSTLDLRSLPEHVNPGVGLFVSDKDLGSNYRQFADIPKEADRVIFASMLGVKTVDGSTLNDWIASFLTLYADPFGQTTCKPITPSGRIMEINLGGAIYGMPFDVNVDYCQPAIAVMQQDYKRIAADDQTLASKMLGFWGKQFALNNPEDVFIPADLPKIAPLTPQTTINDDFTRADSGTLGSSSEGWSWSNDVNSISIASNKAKQNTFGGASVGRAVSSLSSADHYAQAVLNSDNTLISYFALGTTTRKIASTVQTYYLGLVDFNAQVAKLFKCVNGSFTQLGSNVAVTLVASTDYTVRTIASGSTQSFNLDGVQKISQTDSAVTGNLQTGIRGDATVGQSVNTATWDNFTASDLAAFTTLFRRSLSGYGSGAGKRQLQGF